MIADDLTGAVDAATCLTQEGLRTVIVTEAPTEAWTEADACVVALKSRTSPPDDAIRASAAAATALLALGARTLFFKYCSTFDSTADGNIGPVADELLRLTGQPIAVLAPGYPANDRTVYQRHLFVGSELLSQSSMRDHPLTPMRDSDLVVLMEAQSVHRVAHVALTDIREGLAAQALSRFAEAGYRYAVVDTIDDGDLDAVAAACSEARLVTGGAGLASAIARRHGSGAAATPWQPAPGGSGVIAGSCAAATRRQVASFAAHGPVYAIDPWQCAEDADAVVGEASAWALDHVAAQPFLIASCADADSLRAVQAGLGVAESAALVEQVLGRIASAVVAGGVSRLLVAGGETSGAVIAALGITRMVVRAPIGPGLAWCETDGGVAVALKSGNFGSDTVFLDAFRVLDGTATTGARR